MHLIFDSHLDLAWNAVTWNRDLLAEVSEINELEREMSDEKFRARATTTFPEMRRGRVAVCLGTMMGRVPYGDAGVHGTTLDFPTHEQVFGFACGQMGYYEALQQAGHVRLVRTSAELNAAWADWKRDPDNTPFGLILAMEGADAIMFPEQAALWFEKGLRCTSLVHYGTSKYAVGTGHDGPITDDGRRLLKAFEEVGMIVDLTHLCDASFFQVVDSFAGPICASHQACRALIPGQRQFSDEQLNIIIARGGVIGVPCDAWMLSPNWVRGKTDRSVVNIDAMVDHIDHICQLAGVIDHVCIGSDLDGGYGTEQTPTGLDTIADLQKLAGIMTDRGYSDEDVGRVLGENWLHFFSNHLPRQ